MAYLEYVESKARTNKLHCTECNSKIKQGEYVVFGLDEERRMEEVFCEACGIKKDIDDTHPFSSDGLGQD